MAESSWATSRWLYVVAAAVVAAGIAVVRPAGVPTKPAPTAPKPSASASHAPSAAPPAPAPAPTAPPAPTGQSLAHALMSSPRAIAVSPDGTRLLMQSETSEGYRLSVVDKEKREVSTITTGKRPHEPAWSPDGGRIAYGIERGRGESELRVWTIAGGREQTPRAPRTRVFTSPQWTHDGKRLAFVVEHAGARQLHVVDMDGAGESVELAKDMTPHAGFAWSKDGVRIATVLVSDPAAISIVSRTAPRQRIPLGDGAEAHDIAWTADATLLVTVRARGEEALSLSEVDINGASTKRITGQPIHGDVIAPGPMPGGGIHYGVRGDKTEQLVICRAGDPCKTVGMSPFELLRATESTIIGRSAGTIYEFDLRSGKSTVLAEPPAGGVAGERIEITSQDGRKIPLFVRRPHATRLRGAVLRVRATEQESPWDKGTDLLHDEGIVVVNVDHEVLAARDWIVKTLVVPAERIVLVGESAGAIVAAKAALDERPFGSVVLIAIPGGPKADAPAQAPARAKRCARVFHGADDEITEAQARATIEHIMGKGAVTPPCGSFRTLAGETHAIERAAAWVEVYQAILGALPR